MNEIVEPNRTTTTTMNKTASAYLLAHQDPLVLLQGLCGRPNAGLADEAARQELATILRNAVRQWRLSFLHNLEESLHLIQVVVGRLACQQLDNGTAQTPAE
jgi:hypothetical protein